MFQPLFLFVPFGAFFLFVVCTYVCIHKKRRELEAMAANQQAAIFTVGNASHQMHPASLPRAPATPYRLQGCQIITVNDQVGYRVYSVNGSEVVIDAETGNSIATEAQPPPYESPANDPPPSYNESFNHNGQDHQITQVWAVTSMFASHFTEN